MPKETDRNPESAAGGDAKLLEADVCRAVEGGEDIQENVRRLTLMALGAEAPDLQSLRRTISAVVQGAQEGMRQQLQETTTQTQSARAQIAEAIAGLDSALAQFAETSKLAMEEAAGQARKFSDEELVRTRTDLESLETLFLEILQGSASAAKGQASDALRDLAQHMHIDGTAVGHQAKDAVETIGRQMTTVGLVPFETGIQLASVTSDLMRNVAAGMLTAAADRIKPSQGSEKSDS
jgi:flagellar capping protein FliD